MAKHLALHRRTGRNAYWGHLRGLTAALQTEALYASVVTVPLAGESNLSLPGKAKQETGQELDMQAVLPAARTMPIQTCGYANCTHNPRGVRLSQE